MSTTVVTCARCGVAVEKSNNQINLARKRGKRLFCTKSCAAKMGHEEFRKVYKLPTEKKCATCGIIKPMGAFNARTGNLDGRFFECRQCRRAKNRKKREDNPDFYSVRAKKYRYGLTPEVEAVILAEQDGVCALCGADPPLVVDHCHQTNRVRGLLCQRCNRGLGMLGDNIAGLCRALAYVSQNTNSKAG